jgi:hypothetical protein
MLIHPRNYAEKLNKINGLSAIVPSVTVSKRPSNRAKFGKRSNDLPATPLATNDYDSACHNHAIGGCIGAERAVFEVFGLIQG